MKIESIESFVVKLPKDGVPEDRPDYVSSIRPLAYETDPPFGDLNAARYWEALFVKVTNESGHVGWGEGQSLLVPEATHTIVQKMLAPLLIGENPLAREKHFDRMYAAMRGRGYRSGYMAAATAGINNALWDLSGRILDIPCYELLGGPYRNKVHIYNNVHGRTPEEGARNAAASVERGYDAVKYHLFRPPEEALAYVDLTREAVGPDVDILVDLTWHYDQPGAIALGRELQKRKVFWLESPVPSEDLSRHAEVAAALDIPVCIGQEYYNAYQFRAVLEAHAADMLLPDLARCGLTGGQRIAHLAETFDIPLSPAVGGGNVYSTAAQLQLSAGILNFVIMEHFDEAFEKKSDMILSETLTRNGSYLEVPERPGLGIEVDEEKLKKYVV
jgi:L-alanine-DL-glutamate epimerase-like enolase superfamily enzyme